MNRRRKSRGRGLTEAAVLCGALGWGGMGAARAGTDVLFSGTLVADPCQIETDQEEQTVEFGAIAQKTFSNHESTAPKSFSIRLSECDLSLGNQVSVTFTGEKDSTIAGSFAITGQARGIALRLENSEGKVVLPDETQPAIDLRDGDTVLSWQARILAGNPGQVTGGDFFSVITFSLTYE